MAPLGAIFISVKRWYVTRPLCLAQPIKRDARRTVRHIYDTGALKPGLGNGSLHGQVVLMRVDTQVIGTLFGKGKHRSRDTVYGAIGRHTVQHGVRSVTAPLTILNYVIAPVRAR